MKMAMLKKSRALLAVALGLASPAAYAAGEDLIGLWNEPGGNGTLEIEEGGTFTGTVTDGDDFTGRWEVGPEGTLSLTRDDGQTAKCTYTVAGAVLTFADCPIAGAYKKAE
jgi:uncharacterized protein (DUF2147 family)